jgi:hypothetical protein
MPPLEQPTRLKYTAFRKEPELTKQHPLKNTKLKKSNSWGVRRRGKYCR